MDEKGNAIYEVDLSFTDGKTLPELLAELLLERPDAPENRSGPC